MAKRQFGAGGPIYDYEGLAALDAPHTVYSKLKVFKVNVNIGSVAANTVLETSVAFPAGSFSSRAICLCMQIGAALEANIVVVPVRVSAADTLLIRTSNTTAGAIDPAAADYEFYMIDP